MDEWHVVNVDVRTVCDRHPASAHIAACDGRVFVSTAGISPPEHSWGSRTANKLPNE